jgi:alpha-glucuronidase
MMVRFESIRNYFVSVVLLSAVTLTLAGAAKGEDGYRLWLRYDPLPNEALKTYRSRITAIVVPGQSARFDAIRNELSQGLSGLLNHNIEIAKEVDRDGAVLVGTPRSLPQIDAPRLGRELDRLGPEGFIIRSLRLRNHSITLIVSQSEVGALYGAFHFLRQIQILKPIVRLNISERPRLRLRLLNHWDNLDGSIERGYAGHSLWNWNELPAKTDARLLDYARANASLGINGSVLNNVNASAKIFTPEYIKKVAAIADGFRPYGVRVYLSARFSAPMELGGLKTADPLDPEVANWWKTKSDEIYKSIPDFGGFLVKANSEGQPGPRTYGRTHLEGANMLADAVAPHKGVVIWRAFVYDMKPGYDRAGAAYEQLKPFDGKFRPNVLLQVKNGPIDFQPREPFHPLFGAMPQTPMMPELQITQEYLGFSNHLVFLAPMWREFLDSDTYAKGRASTVTKVVDGSLFGQKITGMAGVANTGSDRNWTGHDFLQANWFAFGRLAWNPDLPSHQIANEWVAMTLTRNPASISIIARIMLESHEALVDYMMPLGLHHIFWGGHHYGPAPWWDKEKRDDWNPVYYHRASTTGIGFDRTKTGSDTVSQYQRPVADLFSNLNTCPEKFLLWFHHVPWNHRLRSGSNLWDEMARHYQHGVDWVRVTRRQWDNLGSAIDAERHRAVARKLAIQEHDAVWWRDACLAYFQTFSRREIPAGVEKPAKRLEEYKEKSLLSR